MHLDENLATLGFARRAAEYKRADLSVGRRPGDEAGKTIIPRVVEAAAALRDFHSGHERRELCERRTAMAGGSKGILKGSRDGPLASRKIPNATTLKSHPCTTNSKRRFFLCTTHIPRHTPKSCAPGSLPMAPFSTLSAWWLRMCRTPTSQAPKSLRKAP